MHGRVAAVLGTLLGLDRMIDPVPSKRHELVVAMVVAQVIDPSSGLASARARALRRETTSNSLGDLLTLKRCDEDDLYEAMDYALTRQVSIEGNLARAHLADGMLVLYDVSSAAFEGKTGAPDVIGHVKDAVYNRLQIIHPDYPGQRLVVYEDPLLCEKRKRKREALLCAAKQELDKIASAVAQTRRPLRGTEMISLRQGGQPLSGREARCHRDHQRFPLVLSRRASDRL